MTSRLPRKFALLGLIVGVVAMALWWFDLTLNPFHLPSSELAPPNYVEPIARKVIEYTLPVLCPGILLQVFTIGIGGWFGWLMWTVAALLNFPIYYCIGLAVDTLIRRSHAARATAGSNN